MRALLWSDYFWPDLGGTEVVALNLVRGLRARGIDIEVVANLAQAEAHADTPEAPGVRVHRLPLRQAVAQRNVPQIAAVRQELARLLARLRPALIHVVALGPGDAFLGPARSRARVPTLVTLQQGIPAPLLAPSATVGQTLRTAERITTCSHAVREALLCSVPEVAARCSVVYHGPNLAPCPVVAPPAAARILCLGRLVEDKGFDLALRAFAILAPRLRDAHLTIAGDGPQRRVLASLAARLGIATQVDMRGWVHPDAVAPLIDGSSVVMMPSRREPMGMVALEAALRGRPVIAARVGGLPEIVEDEVGGLLVPADDVGALAAALARVLDAPPFAARLGRAAQARAARRFTWQATLDAYHALYLEIAEGTRKGALPL